MLITEQQIDDFKTDRRDITPPLPMVFRLVPILFYLSLVFLVVVGSLALWHAKVAADRLEEARQGVAQVKKDISQQKTARAALEKRIRESTNLESWVLASMPLQPLVVAIIRSMKPDTALVNLSIERDPETPSQLRLSMRMNADSDDQLTDTLEVIRSMNYREISPTQTMIKGDLAYRASLLWQKTDEEEITPQSRAAQALEP